MPRKSAADAARKKPPKYCYWRGDTLWARIKIASGEHRFSLRTSDAKVAKRRVDEERQRLIGQSKFGEVSHLWEEVVVAWSGYIVGEVGAQTVKRYCVSVEQLRPFFREMPISDIGRDQINEMVANRSAAGRTNATIRRDLTALSSVLSFAEDQGWREGNPALSKMRRLSERRDPIYLPEPAHVEFVIARAPKAMGALIRAAWLTGARQAELVFAERKYLSPANRTLYLSRAKGNRPRTIELEQSAWEIVSAQPAAINAPWIFHHDGGEPYANLSSDFSHLVRAAQRVAQKSGVPFRPFRFHDLRHAYAVDYLKRGGSIYDLQRHLGHTSVKTTEIYLGFLTAAQQSHAKGAASRKGAQRQRSVA